MIDWFKAGIGKKADKVIAAELGCDLSSVYAARKRLGISKYVDPKAPLRGQGVRGGKTHEQAISEIARASS